MEKRKLGASESIDKEEFLPYLASKDAVSIPLSPEVPPEAAVLPAVAVPVQPLMAAPAGGVLPPVAVPVQPMVAAPPVKLPAVPVGLLAQPPKQAALPDAIIYAVTSECCGPCSSSGGWPCPDCGQQKGHSGPLQHACREHRLLCLADS